MNLNKTSNLKLLKLVTYLLLAVILCMVVYVRLRLISVPLERDEGEYAYMGQLLLKGLDPYAHAYTLKLPGACIMYAVFMSLWGQTPTGIHLGLLVVNGLSILLVYLIAQRVLDRDAALISCAAYALLSLSSGVLGIFAHATHFVVLFSLSGILLLLKALESQRKTLLFTSGVFLGLAFLMKQHAFVLVCFAFLYLLWRGYTSPGIPNHVTKPVTLLLGVIVPYIITATGIAYFGEWSTFWFWTVTYAREYALEQTFSQGIQNFVGTFGKILENQWPLYLLAGAGGLILLRAKNCFKERGFVSGFFIASFLAIVPGLWFREHYFIILLPAISLMVGTAYSHVIRNFNFTAPLLLTLAIIIGIVNERAYLFTLPPKDVSVTLYGSAPFPEAIEVARYIKEHSSTNDRIAVLGSEPEIYFYANRISATGYIYVYGLMENQPHAKKMQAEMISEIEESRPNFIVMVNVITSWLTQITSPQLLQQWMTDYVSKHYNLVGIVDILDSTQYIWDQKVISYKPQSDQFIAIYKRR